MNLHNIEVSKCHIIELKPCRHGGGLADAIYKDQMRIVSSNMKMCALKEHVAPVPSVP